eukprot:TRINITY_DN1012_c0_g1_i2.p1 TRINITY_DN1012_c0_g1~~TRINITY_DN1012_c0_g1_i2.p1  ORF type:complete len:168 (-),score=9.30 TRINITY_DN1012_c0_g1_i2:243-746(-)
MYKDREIEEGPIKDPYPFAFLTPSPNTLHKPKSKKIRRSLPTELSKIESDSHELTLSSSMETFDDSKSTRGELDDDIVTPNEKKKKNKRIRPLDFGTSSLCLPPSWDSPVTVSSLSSPPKITAFTSPTTALRSLSETHHSQTLSESLTSTLSESGVSKRTQIVSEER